MSDSREGGTPLAFAAAYGHLQVVSLLLDHGVDIEAKDRSGETPIFLAIRQANVEAVDLLLKHGARISAKNASGRRPLQFALDTQYIPPEENAESTREQRQILRIRRADIVRLLQSATVEHDSRVAINIRAAVESRAQGLLATVEDIARDFSGYAVRALQAPITAYANLFPKQTRSSSTLRGRR
ncbi:ankyrin repeat domain-containing protein 52 [Colletotrichum asianum]|uniref:Ankyrin repeat domain-containing protein 52 n=1 Tax=Colletotrichum asianum TaxID=702518 RepID=A0A8H3ZXJ1_9PEZI|nr:ankyrin repeat domain-containing protein 52 [Colletotrichum asianum]